MSNTYWIVALVVVLLQLTRTNGQPIALKDLRRKDTGLAIDGPLPELQQQQEKFPSVLLSSVLPLLRPSIVKDKGLKEETGREGKLLQRKLLLLVGPEKSEKMFFRMSGGSQKKTSSNRRLEMKISSDIEKSPEYGVGKSPQLVQFPSQYIFRKLQMVKGEGEAKDEDDVQCVVPCGDNLPW